MCIPMPNITLSLPEDVYRVVKTHKEIRWSEVARRAIVDYAQKLSLLDTLTTQSELTDDDVMELDATIKAGMARHYRKKNASRT